MRNSLWKWWRKSAGFWKVESLNFLLKLNCASVWNASITIWGISTMGRLFLHCSMLGRKWLIQKQMIENQLTEPDLEITPRAPLTPTYSCARNSHAVRPPKWTKLQRVYINPKHRILPNCGVKRGPSMMLTSVRINGFTGVPEWTSEQMEMSMNPKYNLTPNSLGAIPSLTISSKGKKYFTLQGQFWLAVKKPPMSHDSPNGTRAT